MGPPPVVNSLNLRHCVTRGKGDAWGGKGWGGDMSCLAVIELRWMGILPSGKQT